MADGSDVERLGMLASALAGRPLVVALVGAGEPSWTDGKTVYVDPESSSRAQLESLAVQASLLASGGLDPTSFAGSVSARAWVASVPGRR